MNGKRRLARCQAHSARSGNGPRPLSSPIRGSGSLTARSQQLAAFALTGFANFASVGIQLGGIGAMAPERRHDLARLGGKALFVGFLATLLNAAVAGVLMAR